jgi:hypothetical protein
MKAPCEGDSPSATLLIGRIELDQCSGRYSQHILRRIFRIDYLAIGSLDKSVDEVQVLLADDQEASWMVS